MKKFFTGLLDLALGSAFLIILLLIFTLPATWLLMLFMGNVGLTQVSYWGALPLGILVSALLGGWGTAYGR